MVRLFPICRPGRVPHTRIEVHWCERLTRFDAVVTQQAVHELRHKQRRLSNLLAINLFDKSC